MLRFLRHIRKSLVESSSLRRYILYAIGEILLVMIGILLALQVNNWNQKRIDNELAKQYLVRIKADIEKDTSLFMGMISRNLIIRERIKSALTIMYQGSGDLDHVVAVYDEGLNQVFISNNNTYTDLLSTGNLRLIKNTELKDRIVNLYSQYEEKRKLMESDKKWMDGIAINLDTNVNFIKFSKDVMDIFTQPDMLKDEEWMFMYNPKSEDFQLLVRAISSIAWSLSVNNGYYDELILSCKDVLSAIDKELSKS